MIRHALFACIALALGACGGTETSAEGTTAPAGETQVAAEPDTQAAEPVTSAAPAAAMTVTIEEHSQGGALGSPLALSASPELNAIVVRVTDLTTYCAPDPSFSAAIDGEVLRLSTVRPESVSRCVAPHDLVLRVALPGRNNLRRVVLIGTEGQELGSAVIASSP